MGSRIVREQIAECCIDLLPAWKSKNGGSKTAPGWKQFNFGNHHFPTINHRCLCLFLCVLLSFPSFKSIDDGRTQNWRKIPVALPTPLNAEMSQTETNERLPTQKQAGMERIVAIVASFASTRAFIYCDVCLFTLSCTTPFGRRMHGFTLILANCQHI